MSPRSRLLLAVMAWCLAAVAVMLPIVWLINNRDWGVALMLLVPFAVYGLLRLGRLLEGWARAISPPSGH
ncbi:MAG TPA: hypothetical protein VLO12_02500 [Halomonas sp.]|nr:hypothetical protein [Halomonas sp.]